MSNKHEPPPLFLGFVFIGFGSLIVLIATGVIRLDEEPGVPVWVSLLGVAFFFAGLSTTLLSLGVSYKHPAYAIVMLLMLTAFALTLNWIAFGPAAGEFYIGGVFALLPQSASNVAGRAAFAIPAIFFDAILLVAWGAYFKQLIAPKRHRRRRGRSTAG